MSAALIINWIQSTLTWSAPLIICAMGEVFAERSGVINMGIEGIMLFGALCGVSVCYYSGSPFVAILASIVVGAVLGLAVSYLTVSRRTNQVVTGLMVNMLATGATNLIFALLKETRHNRAQTFSALFPESTFDIPVVGTVLFSQPFSTWVAFLLPFVAAFIMYKTRWGLNVRAVGDNPKACATAGLNVIKIKYQTVILSGIMAALAGCTLTLATSGYFAAGGMTNGCRCGRRLGSYPHHAVLRAVRRGGCSADASADHRLCDPHAVPADAALCHYGHCADHYGQALPRAQDLGCGLRSTRCLILRQLWYPSH